MTQQFVIQGRIVWGHPGKLVAKTDNNTKQKIMKDGQPVMQCAFGLAIDKNTFNQYVLPQLQKEAFTVFPNGTPPRFSWKYKDGDGIDDKGKPFNIREGYAGHCVLTIATQGFTPQIFKMESGQYRQLTAEEIKCGDYAAVNITVKFNGVMGGNNTPGLYVNPNGVVHIGYGTEIVSGGQDPDELFAGYQAQLPAGASATPTMGSAPLPTAMQPGNGYPPQPHQQYPAAAMPTGQPSAPMTAPTTYAPQPATPAMGYPSNPGLPAPAHDFVNNAMGVPPAPPVPSAPFPPAGWTAHPNSPGYFYMGQEVLTEAQLRSRLPGMPAGR